MSEYGYQPAYQPIVRKLREGEIIQLKNTMTKEEHVARNGDVLLTDKMGATWIISEELLCEAYTHYDGSSIVREIPIGVTFKVKLKKEELVPYEADIEAINKARKPFMFTAQVIVPGERYFGIRGIEEATKEKNVVLSIPLVEGGILISQEELYGHFHNQDGGVIDVEALRPGKKILVVTKPLEV